MSALHILSGGAAQALVRGLQPQFESAHGCTIDGTFGAVGAMKDKLLAGAPCDVLILSEALIAQLAQQGAVLAGSARALGRVQTGLAVTAGGPDLQPRTPEALKAALAQASAIYFPDPAKATAGIHFMKVLTALGLADALAGRLHTFPNGAAAMGELARSNDPRAVGCTQVTEILYTPGVRLTGLLPPPHELATVYTAAVCTGAADPARAEALVAALSGDTAAALRREVGFEA